MRREYAERWARQAFGEYLTLLRKEQGLTQKTLGKVASYTDAQVSQVESGKRNATNAYLAAVAPSLGTTVEDLETAKVTAEAAWMVAHPTAAHYGILRALFGEGKRHEIPEFATKKQPTSRPRLDDRDWRPLSSAKTSTGPRSLLPRTLINTTRHRTRLTSAVSTQLDDLSVTELSKVRAFIQGLVAAREDESLESFDLLGWPPVRHPDDLPVRPQPEPGPQPE